MPQNPNGSVIVYLNFSPTAQQAETKLVLCERLKNYFNLECTMVTEGIKKHPSVLYHMDNLN